MEQLVGMSKSKREKIQNKNPPNSGQLFMVGSFYSGNIFPASLEYSFNVVWKSYEYDSPH